MKKYLFTESQIKKVVDNVINEQSEERKGIMTVQCFLNKVLNSKLNVDGKTGPKSNTERAIMNFQTAKIKEGHDLTVDGIWGETTQNSLSQEQQKIWKICKSKYMSFFS